MKTGGSCGKTGSKWGTPVDRIDKILNHDLFLYHLGKNNAAEADRRFCRHSMVHFLDVARIGTIIALEEGLELDRGGSCGGIAP